MKKLKMVVTFLVVLAIVGSAFAFKAKKANFCVAADTTSNTCIATILEDRKIVTLGGQEFHYYNGWDGNTANCGTTTHCSSTVLLDTN